MDKLRKELGSFLQKKRLEAGLSQTELSKAFKYTNPQFVSNWERGLALPPNKALKIMIKLFKLDQEAIVNQMTEAYRENLIKELSGKNKV